MAEVIVRDIVMWTKHVHGDEQLSEALHKTKAGEDIELLVDGVRGHWRKMADGRDGRPTSGLRPQGRMQKFWSEIYASKRGQAITITLPSDTPPAPTSIVENEGPRFFERTREAVKAARVAFLSPRGWSSEGRTVSRDELHER